MRSMPIRSKSLTAMASVLACCGLFSAADARCTRLGFSVNDYGKDGPTADAKKMLDPYIAKWAAEHGLKKYTVGKKDVTCELYLDVGLFDEHTCKASANVCWTSPAPLADAAAAASAKTNATPSKPGKTAAKAKP